MKITRCHGCGRELAAGALKYVVEVRSFADFDGYLEDVEGGEIEERMNELLDAMEHMNQSDIEEDVYRERIYLVCKHCREKFTKDPFKAEEKQEVVEESKGTVH
ncbi:MAG: hypothetical protein OEV59_06440 [Deltaproteobacteria bacterium]|nr:hypothetical protein [Deltaproteobacteria bacterium]